MRERIQQQNWVAAMFQNALIAIKVTRYTTFAQLAEKLIALADIHGQLVHPVHVRIATAHSSRSGYQSSRHAAD
jgi:hypothetical protein